MIVRDRKRKPPAMRPAVERTLVVMVCADMGEAELVSRQLAEVNTGCLVTYRRSEDMRSSVPVGKVALVILATEDEPFVTHRMLRWLRKRWPRCAITVVGDTGCGAEEIVAREGGANYLTRPVSLDQWLAVLSHAVGVKQPVST